MTAEREAALSLRAAREDELPTVVELTAAAFGERVRRRATVTFWGDSTLRPGDVRVADLDGRIVASLRIADRPIAYGVATLRLAGIGGVCTHPAEQHRGYASLVLRHATAAMQTAGYQLGMLFTGIPGFYARLGWMALPQYVAIWPVTPGRGPSPDAAAAIVRPFALERDLPAVEHIYAEASQTAVGPYRRVPHTWRDEQPRILGILPTLAAERCGRVVAYVSFAKLEDSLHVGEAGCLLGEVAAYRPLAAAIWDAARAWRVATLRAHLPRGSGLVAALTAEGAGPPEWRAESRMMLQLLDLGALLRAATPELQRRLAAGGAGEPDDTEIGLNVGGQYARIVLRDGTIQIDPEPVDDEVSIPADLFFRIFLGEQSATVLREQLALAGTDLTFPQVALLDRLFPSRDPIYWHADHF